MNLIFHVLINLIFAIVLILLFPSSISWKIVLIIVLAGILIDIDHLLYYTIHPGNFYSDFTSKTPHFFIFHTIEFVFILILISILSKNSYIIAFSIGVIIHLLTDVFTYVFYHNYSWLKYWSAIYCLLHNI